MITEARKITRKGQVTIPKEIRDKLGATAVYFEVVDDSVMIKPAKDAAGSLSHYAPNAKPVRSIKKMKDDAWEEAVLEKTGKTAS